MEPRQSFLEHTGSSLLLLLLLCSIARLIQDENRVFPSQVKDIQTHLRTVTGDLNDIFACDLGTVTSDASNPCLWRLVFFSFETEAIFMRLEARAVETMVEYVNVLLWRAIATQKFSVEIWHRGPRVWNGFIRGCQYKVSLHRHTYESAPQTW